MTLASTPTLIVAALVIVGLHVNQATPEPIRPFVGTKLGVSNRKTNIHAVRTSGEKFISSLHCVAKKEKSKRVPELGGRELTDLSPDVLTAY